eukprot:CAMPEP_0201566402 /NCGR_PEP_ID=MMETSP0190_2-20130828/6146_1 /ASSEMBLY_ACC=CAM_ASM_000263 /TAXON_ID=37353 /ORGANISM="Rosalina sp." /LENGTH=440 /DNA_ID=CAMNT_0047985053 /DNA_START=9 /DNA_END=1331 /DNA_ORIENTATION=+
MAAAAYASSSNALTPMTKKYLSMSKSSLLKTCKKYKVDTYGVTTKKEMIARIIYAKEIEKKPHKKVKKKKKKKKKKNKPKPKPKPLPIQPPPKQPIGAPSNDNLNNPKKPESPLKLVDSTTDEIKEEKDGDEQNIVIEQNEDKLDDEGKDDEKDPKQLLNKEYISKMSEIEGYGIYSSIEGLCDRSTYKSHKNDPADPKSDNFKKIMRELRKQLPKNIYTSSNGAMFVRFDENHPRFMQALLTGLEGTPYASGLFLFDIYLPSSYPQNPCHIKHITHGATLCHANNGPGGFSPNLHQSSGKVCLSLLGTWNGPGWKPGQSNVYQVLSSLLFMVFGAKHPYYMEPGFGGWEGNALKKKKHIKKVWQYDEEIIYHNVKYAMVQALKSPYKGFEEVIKNHFKIKGGVILKTVKKWMKHKKLSQGFKNKMSGVYKELETEIKKL